MAGDAKQPREIPYCAIVLVICALLCHYLVLIGNMSTASAMSDVGKSTDGWSKVGLNLAESFDTELDYLLANTSAILVSTLDNINDAQEQLDTFLSQVGNCSDIVLRAVQEWLEEPPLNSSHLKSPLKGISNLVGKQVPTASASASASSSGATQSFEKVAAEVYIMMKARLNELGPIENLPPGSYVKLRILAAAKDVLAFAINALVVAFNDLIINFFDTIKPALVQVGKWLLTFGDNLQSTIETFSTSLDMVQKILDQMMSSASSGGEGAEQMEYDTYTLFDVSGAGKISADDLQEVAVMYGIDALSGDKAEQLVQKYDADGDDAIDEKEYSLLVQDPSVPNVMSIVLRTFAKSLSVIAGNVAAAQMRDEVADAVAQYVTLISAKNITKLQWVAQRLSNGSVPTAFTADVLVELAEDLENPDKLTEQDVGQMLVNEMCRMNATHLDETLELMADPNFWTSEGFNPVDQADTVEQVTEWVVNADQGNRKTKLMSLLAMKSSKHGSASSLDTAIESARKALPRQAATLVQVRVKQNQATRNLKRVQRQDQLTASSGASFLLNVLFGGSSSSSAADSSLADLAVQSGQPAVPATLEFAKFLSWNASDTADRFQQQCFDYSKTSSNALNSFSDNIKDMVKQVSTFLSHMQEYSTDVGIERLENQIVSLNRTMSIMILSKIMPYVSQELDKLPLEGSNTMLLLHIGVMKPSMDTTLDTSEVQESMDAVFYQVTSILTNLLAALPDVVESMKDARKQVSAAAGGLKSIFSTLQLKGPPIFDQISAAYKDLWVAYFIVFATVTVGLLIYVFWLSNTCKSEEPADSDYEAPTTFSQRLCCCCNACSACCSAWQSGNCGLWCCIITMEVIVLILFIVSIVLCLLTGVKAFVTAGCSELYILNDMTICQGTLNVVKTFVETFWKGGLGAFSNVCTDEKLVTCNVIGAKLKDSTLGIVVGSIMAAIFTFQLIIESAVHHERHAWRKSNELEASKVD